MDDFISRQAAIDRIVAIKPTNPTKSEYTHGIDTGLAMAMVTIKSQPSAQSERKWIPVSERLPEEEKKTYWVCTDAEYQCECRWTNNRFGIGEGEWGWSIFDTPKYTKPIAWMSLPEPYKEER